MQPALPSTLNQASLRATLQPLFRYWVIEFGRLLVRQHEIILLKFFREWRSRRERARLERAQFESSDAAFVADSEPDAPSASKYPEAAKYRFAWKRTVALHEIYAERSDQTQVEYYQRVRKRLAEAYFAVAPEGPYGKRKLKIQPDLFVKLKTAELARMSMLFYGVGA